MTASATDSSPPMTATTGSPATTDPFVTSDADTGGTDPLADCVIPQSETASITGTIDGVAYDFRYAWFSGWGGGLCESAVRVVLFEDASEFVDNADSIPYLHDVPHLEIWIGVNQFADPFVPGEYEATCTTTTSAAKQLGTELNVSLTSEPFESSYLDGSVAFAPDEEVFVLTGNFNAALCPGLHGGGCGE